MLFFNSAQLTLHILSSPQTICSQRSHIAPKAAASKQLHGSLKEAAHNVCLGAPLLNLGSGAPVMSEMSPMIVMSVVTVMSVMSVMSVISVMNVMSVKSVPNVTSAMSQ